MMILIHGSDQTASRKKLQDMIREKLTETVYFDGSKLTLPDLLLANEAGSLFNEAKIIVIENFFKGLKQKEKDKILAYLKQDRGRNLIIFWDDRDVAAKAKLFPAANNLKFDYPKLLFKFLDDLGRQPSNVLLNYFHLLLKEKEAGLIFAMIVRQFRFLLMLSDNRLKESLNLAPWQIGKFRRQAGFFRSDSLLQNYRLLLNIDYRVKTGQTPLRLDQLIDIFIISL